MANNDKPDRIDFTMLRDGRVVVNKFRREANPPRYIRIEGAKGHSVKPADFDLESALGWCEEHGYTVRRWVGGNGLNSGARAWLGDKPLVIRSAGQLRRLRERHFGAQIDFAYDG